MHTHLSSTCLFPSLMCDVSVYRHQMHFFYSTPTTAVVVVFVDGSYWHFYLHLFFPHDFFFGHLCSRFVYLSTFIRSDCSNMCRLAMILWICFFLVHPLCVLFLPLTIFSFIILLSLWVFWWHNFFSYFDWCASWEMSHEHTNILLLLICVLYVHGYYFLRFGHSCGYVSYSICFFFERDFFSREFDQMPFLFSYGTGDRTS